MLQGTTELSSEVAAPWASPAVTEGSCGSVAPSTWRVRGCRTQTLWLKLQ